VATVTGLALFAPAAIAEYFSMKTPLVPKIPMAVYAVFFAVIAVVGVIAGSYLWWKTREVRKQMREFAAQNQSVMRAQSASNDEVFEGEVIRVVDPKKVK